MCYRRSQAMPVAQNEMPCRLQGDINDAARFLAALEDLQELGLMNNEVRAFGRPPVPHPAGWEVLGSAHLKSRPVPSLCCSQQLGRAAGGEDVCNLVQGTVEMLQLSGMGLKGKLPHCLFDAKSTLFSGEKPCPAEQVPHPFGWNLAAAVQPELVAEPACSALCAVWCF